MRKAVKEVNQLIEDFETLSDEQKRRKVLSITKRVYRKSHTDKELQLVNRLLAISEII